jgi:exopolyphosphatase/guanosine-5'-triphosphate,3'-diphosphate pyrophosphatase
VRVAVVDIGTNSTRLLVADVADGQVAEVERRSIVTRLGRGVDTSGQLAGEAMEDVFRTVAEYVETYESLGAERVNAIATSAVRDAANSGAFIAELRERFGLDARILAGAEEAGLVYLGATADRPASSDSTLVIDIGGGSTELVVGTGHDVGFYVSTQVGVVRHTERYIATDPPTAAELDALAADACAIFEAAVPPGVRQTTRAAIAVAGTATSLGAIDLDLERWIPNTAHGHRLTLASCAAILERLAALPESQRRMVRGLHPDRAPTIIAGVVVLIEALRAFGLDSTEVSDHDILRGAALEEVHRGRHGGAPTPAS